MLTRKLFSEAKLASSSYRCRLAATVCYRHTVPTGRLESRTRAISASNHPTISPYLTSYLQLVPSTSPRPQRFSQQRVSQNESSFCILCPTLCCIFCCTLLIPYAGTRSRVGVLALYPSSIAKSVVPTQDPPQFLCWSAHSPTHTPAVTAISAAIAAQLPHSLARFTDEIPGVAFGCISSAHC